MINRSFGDKLRKDLKRREIVPFIGIYDAFSASIVAQHYDSLFVSGFGFAASYYGLPDIGFISWPDIVAFLQRIRTILPRHNILVDIDDGFADVEVACHVVATLESLGASGVVIEDQKRPRKCGHFDGKQILELDEYLIKLERVLQTRKKLFVVARTDSADPGDILARVKAFDATEVDAILVDGLCDFEFLRTLRQAVKKPLVFNQIKGGKSASCDLAQLSELGVSLVIYSTPCLFSVQKAIHAAMKNLKEEGGSLENAGSVSVKECTELLQGNLIKTNNRKHVSQSGA